MYIRYTYINIFVHICIRNVLYNHWLSKSLGHPGHQMQQQFSDADYLEVRGAHVATRDVKLRAPNLKITLAFKTCWKNN